MFLQVVTVTLRESSRKRPGRERWQISLKTLKAAKAAGVGLMYGRPFDGGAQNGLPRGFYKQP